MLLLFIPQGPNAFAHAQLVATDPGINKTINILPTFIWIEFNENLMVLGDKNPNTISVTDSKNMRVDIGGSLAGGARVSTKLKSNLKPGRYKVSYRIVSEDGHPIQNFFYFTYRP